MATRETDRGYSLPARRQRLWASLAIGLVAALALLSVPSDAPSAAPQRGAKQGWEDQFDGNKLGKRWNVGSWWAPGYLPDKHVGYYESDHVSLGGGYLALLLNQEYGQVDDNPDGVISHGALVTTRQKYGYGTYEWRMRMSSTASTPTGGGVSTSGGVSAGFTYVNNSQTEIDFEFSGHLPGTLYMVNWYNTDPSSGPFGSQETYTPVYFSDLNSQFKTYKFVWEPGRISFYVDDVLQVVHTTNVPSEPAYFMINHWGTDNANGWGGAATVGTDRYFYVD